MPESYEQLKEATIRMSLVHQPEFYRINNQDDKKKWTALLEQGNVALFDEIRDQLKELIKSRNAMRKIQDAEYDGLIAEHLAGCPMQEYGVWVYYPWSNRLIHILDEAEFIELRTSANRNKISARERDVLVGKKVGVIGLSVGQSVSATLAMERTCGELRLADFDTLELNNLNRIRTGLHNLGVYKVYSVAREIAELDPFLKVVCYREGITEENIDRFFTEGGKLDAVIDECDGVNVKILCRLKAKELHVPVLMEASDRGTLDVERFDLHPEMPIMHGWLQHLDLDMNVLRNLKTNEEKLPYMLPIAGFDTLSNRMKGSLLEMGISITTWPQLATAVTLGGAITADTCRRMFLDQYTDSGRYFIDLEQLIPDKREKKTYRPEKTGEPLTAELIDARCAAASARLGWRANIINHNEIEALVKLASQAASQGNMQPWKWHYAGGYLYLFRDGGHEGLFSHINGRVPMVDLGSTLEMLAAAARNAGYAINVHTFPVAGDDTLIAAISFDGKNEGHSGSAATEEHSAGGENSLPAVVAGIELTMAGDAEISLSLLSRGDDVTAIKAILAASERLKQFIPAGHYEFFNRQVKWPGQPAEDGIPLPAIGLGPAEMMSMRIMMNEDIAAMVADWRGGKVFEFIAGKTLAGVEAVGLIRLQQGNYAGYVAAGMALQRISRAAAAHGYEASPVQLPLLLFAHATSATEMPPHVREEIGLLQQRFRGVLGDDDGNVCLFALQKAADMPVLPRKPIEKILSYGKSG